MIAAGTKSGMAVSAAAVVNYAANHNEVKKLRICYPTYTTLQVTGGPPLAQILLT